MGTVHVFVSTGRFRSFKEMRTFIDETYTEDGDGVPSRFIEEVGLTDYEPGCIEAIHSKSGTAIPLTELLAESSWADQWVRHLRGDTVADSAICVFDPNKLRHPARSSLEYLGAFSYTATLSKEYRDLTNPGP